MGSLSSPHFGLQSTIKSKTDACTRRFSARQKWEGGCLRLEFLFRNSPASCPSAFDASAKIVPKHQINSRQRRLGGPSGPTYCHPSSFSSPHCCDSGMFPPGVIRCLLVLSVCQMPWADVAGVEGKIDVGWRKMR